jgi:glycosyltransferase involved in cell wall biosynthesis
VWRDAAAVKAISKTHLAQAKAFLPDLDILVLPNGVDTMDYHPPAEVPPPGRPPTLVCVGRLIERKGQAHLLRALALLTDPAPRLLLVGTGDSEPAYRALAKELGLGDRVEFRGAVGRADMPAVYREADLFVLPSQSEGMSIALLEAMASGLPIAVTDTGGTEELLRDNGVLVPWADPAGLAAALRPLLADPASLLAMGRRSRAIAMEFSWPDIAGRVLAICRDIAARNGRSS